MSVLMEFLAGRADEIVAHLDGSPDDDVVEARVARARADFSLHIGTDALDDLIAAACDQQRVRRFTWDEAAVDTIGNSLIRMPPEFVQLFSSAEGDKLVEAARPWLGDAMTPDFQKAICELVDLCKQAKQETIDVVFTWSA